MLLKNNPETRKKQEKKPKIGGSCDSCEFYSEDEFEGSCTLSLDEDEFADFIMGRTGQCPYYRYYDEYKTVHKQI